MATEIRISSASALASIGAPRPHLMTGYFRSWFTNHFSAENNIEHPEIRSLLWSSLDSSEIMIESITHWKPATTGKRPAIIISRNDWKVLRPGIDNRMMGNGGPHGTDFFATYIEGSHTMFCLSGKAFEAEILAAEVYREMIQFSSIVRQELELMRFAVVGVGKIFEVEESRGNFAVPVTAAYCLEERWKLVPQTPILKKIILSEFLP